MKFRPQIQLRFRDADQYESVKAMASGKSLSVNEYVIQAVEAVNGAVERGGSAGEVGRGAEVAERGAVAEPGATEQARSGTGSSQSVRGTNPEGTRVRERSNKETRSAKVMSKSDQLRALRERGSK